MFTIGHTRSPYDAHRETEVKPGDAIEFSLDAESQALARKAMEQHKARIQQTNEADLLREIGIQFPA